MWAIDIVFRAYAHFVAAVMAHEGVHGHLGNTRRTNEFVRWRGLAYSFTGEKLTGEQLQMAFAEAAVQFPDLPSIGCLTCVPSLHPVPHYRVVLVQSEQHDVDGAPIVAFVEKRPCEFNREFRAKLESGRLGRMIFEAAAVKDFVRGESQFKFLPLYPLPAVQ